MWFGTHEGLSRFDGYSFKVFRSNVNDTSSLIRPLIYALNQDKNGNLWIGTIQGVSVYNIITGRFATIHYRPQSQDSLRLLDDVVRVVETDQYNNVFLGTEKLGLLYCKNAAAEPVQLKFASPGKSESPTSILAVKEGPGNKLWVFVQNKGLFLLDYKSMLLNEVNATLRYARCLEIDGDRIWVGTPEGVYQYDTRSNTYTKLRSGGNDGADMDDVMSLSIDKNRNLWIGTNGAGIKIWNPGLDTMEHLIAGDSKYSLSAGVVYDIYSDEQQRTWIGTLKGGVNIVDPKKKRFQVIAHEPGTANGLKGNSITSFYESDQDNIWIGTDDAGINLWNRKKNSFINYPVHPYGNRSMAPAPVTALQQDSDKTIWIGTWTAGVQRLNPRDGAIRHYKCVNPVSGFENPVISVFYKDRGDTLWAAGLRQGNRYAALYYYNKLADKFDAFDTKLTDLFALTEDKAGNLWGGNLTHLVKIDRVHKQHIFHFIGFAIRHIHEDRQGRLWVATDGGGIMLFDPKQNKIISRFTTENGLANNSVLNILEDVEKNLWISTPNGLSKFNLTDNRFKNYYYNDGLQSNQFNQNAAVRLQSGELMFGGIKGFNIFQPASIVPLDEAPTLAFTNLEVNNQPVDFANTRLVRLSGEIIKLTIPYNQAVLSFDFAALEYSAPEKISYAYYLEGWDRDWNYSGKLRTANYTHLSEGSYIFRVKSTNAEGAWSDKEIAVKITILPPWYRSWWAYIAYALIAGSLIYVYWLYRSRQTRLKYEIALANVTIEKEKIETEKHRAEYEKEKAVHEADRIINEKEKELNKKRLDFFTNIAHEFRTPLTLIINPVKDLLQKDKGNNEKSGELPIVYRNARRLLSLVDQLLFFRKADVGIDKVRPAKLNFYSLCHEVYLCFVQQAKARNIQYDFVCDNQQLELYVDREKMEIVLYNLLSNAIKYTPDYGTILFEVVETGEEVEIKVTDTGSGIPAEVGDKLFDKFYKVEGGGSQSKPGFGIGLYLVKQFVEVHIGDVSYTSAPGKGTTFLIQLKKGKEHFDPALISDEAITGPVFLDELHESEDSPLLKKTEARKEDKLQPVVTAKQVMLVVDDDPEIRRYIKGIFNDQFIVFEAGNGMEGLTIAESKAPDIIISDIKMEGGDGIDLCRKIKGHASLGHTPVILLTGTQSQDVKLEGVEGGADDYITKPFDKELLVARVANLQKSRANLQKYFFNEITLNKQDLKISEEYKEFLERCIAIVEAHLDDDEFSVAKLAVEMGQSYSSVYKKIRMISGQSLKSFVRFIRLRKAAELFINTNYNVNEVAFQVGIYDAKFFREQFNKVFGMKPSEYIKKYRKPFQGQYTINPNSNQ